MALPRSAVTALAVKWMARLNAVPPSSPAALTCSLAPLTLKSILSAAWQSITVADGPESEQKFTRYQIPRVRPRSRSGFRCRRDGRSGNVLCHDSAGI